MSKLDRPVHGDYPNVAGHSLVALVLQLRAENMELRRSLAKSTLQIASIGLLEVEAPPKARALELVRANRALLQREPA